MPKTGADYVLGQTPSSASLVGESTRGVGVRRYTNFDDLLRDSAIQ
jgi:hypothetical protein